MDSFYATCNQIDTDLGLNLYHDHHDYLVMPGVKGFEQTTFPVLLDDSPREHNVKVDKRRLDRTYTVNGEGLEFIKPEKQSKRLGIDEFSLHKGHVYATVIMDLDTGHVLWLAYGKTKDGVYDFIDHVGIEWMKGVECVASDMNADFLAAFKSRCPWINGVYDKFHLIKNFNEKVVSEVRKDEQARLIAEGIPKEAERLKRSKYTLMTTEETRHSNDHPEVDKNGKIKKKRRKSNDKEQNLFAQPKKKKSQIEMEKAYQNIIKDKLHVKLRYTKRSADR